MGNTFGTHRRGLAIGCGGTLGAAWIVAALAAARDVLGWDPREADALIGTSAGAELVTMLGSGVDVGELVDMQLGTATHPVLARHHRDGPGRFPPLPRPRLGSPRMALRGSGSPQHMLIAGSGLLPRGGGDASWLQRLADGLNPGRDWVPHPATWLVATDFETGTRVPFGSPGAPRAELGAALRASWAVPGWYPPVPIGGRRYVDGGVASTASVDLLAPLELDELVVLAPMASAGRIPASGPGHLLERQLRNRMSDTLDAEIAAARASGTRVLYVAATAADLAVMGPNFMDDRRRGATLEHAMASTRRTIV
ncbi:patatin-like phospholipase family protein [Nocardia albiluteola]|uniref:patatin-like phospholipase family protein n=1 Tax=Nocardia albiluteola TaxID=2842303 RepID=UPI0027DF39C1|nr:patatin-like phospholipase family protein [Nocardia albiluteola]